MEKRKMASKGSSSWWEEGFLGHIVREQAIHNFCYFSYNNCSSVKSVRILRKTATGKTMVMCTYTQTQILIHTHKNHAMKYNDLKMQKMHLKK